MASNGNLQRKSASNARDTAKERKLRINPIGVLSVRGRSGMRCGRYPARNTG
jgi:hypothetical protein